MGSYSDGRDDEWGLGIVVNVFLVNINGIFDVIDVDNNNDVADSPHCPSAHWQCS